MNAPINMVGLRSMAEKKTVKPKSPRITGASRGHKCSGEELRKLVRKACLEKFRRIYGFDWDPLVEKTATYNPDPNQLEKQAQKIWAELRAAMSNAVAFVNENRDADGGRDVRRFISWWVPEFIEPLTKYSNFEFIGSGKTDDASRVRLIKKFEDYDMLGLQSRGMKRMSTFPSHQEYALISLLCGTSEKPELQATRDSHWPVGTRENMTAGEVLERETDTMRRLLSAHGRSTVLDTACRLSAIVRGK